MKRFFLLSTALIAAGAAHAGGVAFYGGDPEPVAAQATFAPVVTFPGREKTQRVIDGATTEMITHAGGIMVDMATTELTPGNGYTLWFVVVNEPQHCANAPCTIKDVVGGRDTVISEVSFGAGAIADAEGAARFTTHRTTGPLQDQWFGHGLQNPMTAEVHLIIRDHGSMDGLTAAEIEDALTTHAGQCNPEKLPGFEGAKIGMPGEYACKNVQVSVMVQDGGAGS